MYSDGNRIVQQIGDRTAGGAHAEYRVVTGSPCYTIGRLTFQHNTIPLVGVVGWTNECLLAVVQDRLRAFQDGGFECAENAEALQFVTAALKALEMRTANRLKRGVEGKHEK